MNQEYDINSDPFTTQRINGELCATYGWRLTKKVHTGVRPLENFLDWVPHGRIFTTLQEAGLDPHSELCDRIVEVRQGNPTHDPQSTVDNPGIVNTKAVYSVPFLFDLPSDEERLDVKIRAYVFRSLKEEFTIQEHHQGQRPALPGVSEQLRVGSETLRCSLRCYGKRDFEETGALAQRLKMAVERLRNDVERTYLTNAQLDKELRSMDKKLRDLKRHDFS